MAQCPKCRSELIHRTVLQYGASVCYRCFEVGFTRTTLEGLTGERFFSELEKVTAQVSGAQGVPCFLCATPMRTVPYPFKETSAEARNLDVFTHWRYWYDHHRRGRLEMDRCTRCGGAWINSRTLCQLPIDWDRKDSEYRELERVRRSKEDVGLPEDPIQALAALSFGIPVVENVPAMSDIPSYSIIFGAIGFMLTWQGHKDPEFFRLLSFDPSRSGFQFWIGSLTYVFVNPDWLHYFYGVIGLFLFSPMVEYELTSEHFLSLVLLSAFVSSIVPMLNAPQFESGNFGVIAGLACFFCARFPNAIIGIGSFPKVKRFAAPSAFVLMAYVDITVVGFNVGIGHLSAAAVGYLFHELTGPGKVSSRFEKMAEHRRQDELNAKNWRDRAK
jgi:membrane associated rhomboid family serine protease/Zn-finger nucleic acid-binding protein